MIDILLAAYNGEKYIAEQIESILNQTYTDWTLYVKDDCSTDKTVEIVRGYEEKYSKKIKLILSEEPSGSAKNNYFSMLKYSTSDYIMTCDQDDVWLPNKIELTYSKMKETENSNKEAPVLVHTDLSVVDKNLNVISESLFKLQNMDSSRDKINHLLVQNIVTGCTVMVNRKLLSYIAKMPRHAIMHDWWMALIASALGKVVFIDKPTVLYRQHGNNDVGAKNVNSINYISRRLGNVKKIRQSIENTYHQSEELLGVIEGYLDENVCSTIKQYSLMPTFSKMTKIRTLQKYKLYKNGFVRIIGQIIFC